MEKAAALRQTKLFSELDAGELASIGEYAFEKFFPTGKMLFVAGEESRGLFVVVSGRLRAFQQNSEGREQVMHVDTAGATIGEVPVFDGGPYPASVIAEEDTHTLFIPKQEMQQFCLDHPHFAVRALKLMAERVRSHASLVRVLSLHEVGQRLALFFLTEARKNPRQEEQDVTFRLTLSNHEIATRIGSVRDVVSRALVRLQREGLIVAKNRKITIVDRRALEHYAMSPLH